MKMKLTGKQREELKEVVGGLIMEHYDDIVLCVGRGGGLLDLADKIIDEIELD